MFCKLACSVEKNQCPLFGGCSKTDHATNCSGLNPFEFWKGIQTRWQNDEKVVNPRWSEIGHLIALDEMEVKTDTPADGKTVFCAFNSQYEIGKKSSVVRWLCSTTGFSDWSLWNAPVWTLAWIWVSWKTKEHEIRWISAQANLYQISVISLHLSASYFPVPLFTSCRAVLSLMGFLGGMAFFMMRYNVSVALVCMTTPQYQVVSYNTSADLLDNTHNGSHWVRWSELFCALHFVC